MFTVQVSNLCKHFSSKSVLNNISVTFQAGKVYALLGENGAGKSTFASILTGSQRPSSGTICIDGEGFQTLTTADAQRMGICIVHQRPLLASSLTARENIVLGSEPQLPFGIINKKQIFKLTETLKQTYLSELEMPLNTQSAYLTADMRFFTAYLAALYKKPKLLILDEPTAALDSAEKQILFSSILQLVQEGTSVIIITHNMQEAAEYADAIIILEYGQIQTINNHNKTVTAQILKDRFVEKKETEQTENNFSVCNRVGKICVFQTENITALPREGAAIRNISFSLYTSHILLIEGQRENGLQLLEDIITGMYEGKCSGSIRLTSNTETQIFNLATQHLTCGILRKAGSAIIPFDRTYRASHPLLTVEQICCAGYHGKNPLLHTKHLIEQAQIKIQPHEYAAALSGGMLQRLILERELSSAPVLLILSDPLQGLDTVKAAELAQRFQQIAHNGTAVLILAAAGQYPRQYCTQSYLLSDGTLKEQKR